MIHSMNLGIMPAENCTPGWMSPPAPFGPLLQTKPQFWPDDHLRPGTPHLRNRIVGTTGMPGRDQPRC